MRLLQAFKNEAGAFETQPLTLDALWAQAAKIGRIEIDDTYHKGIYRVRIRFERSTGSLVYAEGKDASIHQAMAMALEEAHRLRG